MEEDQTLQFNKCLTSLNEPGETKEGKQNPKSTKSTHKVFICESPLDMNTVHTTIFYLFSPFFRRKSKQNKCF